MKTPEEARQLAQALVDTGKSLGKKVVALLTRMDVPLGSKVGNFLEVEESLALLGAPRAQQVVPVDGRSDDLMDVTVRLTGWMLVAGGVVPSIEEGVARCRRSLEDGSAWKAMERNIRAQGGDVDRLMEQLGQVRAPLKETITAPEEGLLGRIDAYAVGMGGVYLGAGRSKADDTVYPDVGFELLKKPGDPVKKGEPPHVRVGSR